MKKSWLIGCGIVAIILIILIGLLFWGLRVYNNLVSLEEGVNSSWAQVENQYQRRYDLIPNLVNTVKGVANFEKQTLTAVIEARSKVGQMNISPEIMNDPKSFEMFQQRQGELSSALSRLMVVVEQYPQLKANENFLQLQAQLEGTENRIAVERMRFNETVQSYNIAIRKFPAAVFAGIFGFKEKTYFKSTEGADTAPQVQFE